MDELELLKKDWKRSEESLPKLSYNEIYKMILKKSSSIVKWIFIISILEFILWTCVSFLLKDADYNTQFSTYGADNIMIPLTVIGYAFLFYFFYLFYMNYKRISVVENAKSLMEKILKTRRTVKQYVAFNLIYLALTSFIVLGIMMEKDESLIAVKGQAAADGELLLFYAKTFGLYALTIGIAILLILGFYYLIYGLLMKRLNKNYKELKRIEI